MAAVTGPDGERLDAGHSTVSSFHHHGKKYFVRDLLWSGLVSFPE